MDGIRKLSRLALAFAVFALSVLAARDGARAGTGKAHGSIVRLPRSRRATPNRLTTRFPTSGIFQQGFCDFFMQASSER